MERCIACRARLDSGPLCPRCGCDYSLALAAENAGARLLRQAVHAWCADDRATAAHLAGSAGALSSHPLAYFLARRAGVGGQ